MLLSIAILVACSAGIDTGQPDASLPLDGPLAPGPWGNEVRRLDIAADGSATLDGGCAHSAVAEATAHGGAFDWTLDYTEEVAYVDTGRGDPSYPVEFLGTIAGDTLDGRLLFDGAAVPVTLTRGVETEVGTCD